jgi:short subunit dehydrogenase-like uncharacterized protein
MKQFDVAVLGSTGFTGRLVCKHIVQQYHGKVRSAADQVIIISPSSPQSTGSTCTTLLYSQDLNNAINLAAFAVRVVVYRLLA